MSDTRLVVLKFGGSVLRDEASLGSAVHEIYRWRRDGWRTLAVVSALAGRTDELLARASRLGLDADSRARAALAAGGELESAALLAALLERAGVPAACLPAGLRARGPVSDAVPVAAGIGRLRAALGRLGVVVCPGFIAHDHRGETVLLGRGGSDLTALCLAKALGAKRCILIKDVDGLYDRDPALPGPPAVRYETAGWDDALATDGSIIQHKAIRFAQRHRLGFELGTLNATAWTRIGDHPARAGRPTAHQAPLRVGILGHGTVGGGVARLLAADARRFTLAGVAVRDPSRHELPAPLVGDPLGLAGSDVDVVVEVMGGVDVAREAVAAALRRGVAVVTANKDLLSAHGGELAALADRHGGRLLASAAVGGSVPVLEAIGRPGSAPLVELSGVLNGTANFVLEACEAGSSLAVAIAEARRLGYAEADTARDLDGRDAAAKLCAAAQQAGGPPLAERDVLRQPVVGAALRPGMRQVASMVRDGDSWRAQVCLAPLAPDSLLRRARAAQNVVIIRRDDGSQEILHGGGAGRWPTAESVVGDLWQLLRERASVADEDRPGCRDAGPEEIDGLMSGQNALTTPIEARPPSLSMSKVYSAVTRRLRRDRRLTAIVNDS
jgi:homoserine dehydrogenase